MLLFKLLKVHIISSNLQGIKQYNLFVLEVILINVANRKCFKASELNDVHGCNCSIIEF